MSLRRGARGAVRRHHGLGRGPTFGYIAGSMRLPSLVLVLALGAATAAACGSSPTPGPAGPDPGLAEAPTATPSAEAPPPGSATPAASGSGPVSPSPAPGPDGNVPVHASAMLDKLAALGLDPKNLPAFDELSFDQKKKVMPLFKQSLGYEHCTGCHVEGDFKKVTTKMQIAEQMWDHFVVDLRRQGGEPLFCDSCHGGKEEPYDDSDMATVRKFMAAEYVDKLERKDGKPHDCKTCHGDKLELEIIEKLWKIAEK